MRRLPKLTQTPSYAAYWIAFGAHGPRALDPPGEGKKVALYVAVGMGVSLALFGLIRSFAGPAPATMTKEWQEQTNEYLKVGACYALAMIPTAARCSVLTENNTMAVSKRGSSYRYLVRGIHGQGHGSVSPGQALNPFFSSLSLSFSLSQYHSAALPHGHFAVYKSFDGMLGLAGTVAQGGWCKYCTTTETKQYSFEFIKEVVYPRAWLVPPVGLCGHPIAIRS